MRRRLPSLERGLAAAPGGHQATAWLLPVDSLGGSATPTGGVCAECRNACKCGVVQVHCAEIQPPTVQFSGGPCDHIPCAHTAAALAMHLCPFHLQHPQQRCSHVLCVSVVAVSVDGMCWAYCSSALSILSVLSGETGCPCLQVISVLGFGCSHGAVDVDGR